MTPPEPVAPDYDGACVTRVVPALLEGGDLPAWVPGVAQGARAVVLLVLDGLGWDTVAARREGLDVLGDLEGGPITTVAPSTTAAALTSLATGLAPTVHGVVGFRMRMDGGVLNVLSWRWSGPGSAPDAFTVQRHAAFGRRSVPVVTQSEFRHTPFTEAQLRGGRFEGWSTPAVLVERTRRLVAEGERFVEVYYPGIDKVAHEHGLRNGYHDVELAAADALVGTLLDVLPADVALLVTSDHGQVHLEPEDWVEITALEPMVAIQAGDARFRYLYARPGAAADLADAAREELGHLAWVLTRRELLERGWLGPAPKGGIGARIGDVTLAAHRPVAFVDPSLPRERQLRSAHGSLTPEEMLVPLVGGRGHGAR